MAEIIALTEALRRPIAIYHRPAAGASARDTRTLAIELPLLAAAALEHHGHRGERTRRGQALALSAQHICCCCQHNNNKHNTSYT